MNNQQMAAKEAIFELHLGPVESIWSNRHDRLWWYLGFNTELAYTLWEEVTAVASEVLNEGHGQK